MSHSDAFSSLSDLDSDLSDPPDDLDEIVFSPDAESMDSSESFLKRRSTASPSLEDSDSDATDRGHSQDSHSTPYGSSKLEELPNEVRRTQ